MNRLAFDIETIPDIVAGRRVLGLEDCSDEDVARAMFHRRSQETGGSEFLRPHLHRIVAISCVLRSEAGLTIWSLGDESAHERELVQRFFDGIERFTPVLVSWNGAGFDLPVLHYRSLIYGIAAPRYWDVGDGDTSFRWNNYLNRFHWRHVDLMDVLSGYQPRAAAPLDEIATMLGYPGKMGMDGSHVWDRYLAGDLSAIRNYCETDALNTYLVFRRFDLMRGQLDADQHRREEALVRETLESLDREHLTAFLRAWTSEDTNHLSSIHVAT